MTSFTYAGNVVQTYTVTATGEYDVQASGAAGGSTLGAGATFESGGKGASDGGIFYLTAGEQLEVVVGGAGQGSTNFSGGGGGGGTFILANIGPGNSFVPLLVAAGGGGAGYVMPGQDGTGGPGQIGSASIPGVGGDAGGAGGGTGFLTAGGSVAGGAQGGTLYTGGAADPSDVGGTGGYGGGGGGGSNSGGGGGGYTGGQGGQPIVSGPTGGSGATSFFANTAIMFDSQSGSGTNGGDGFASIDLVAPTVVLTSAPASGPDGSSFTITGSASYGANLPLAGGQVTLTDNGQNVGAAQTAADGSFSANVTLPFVSANNVIATVVDQNGATGASAPARYNLFEAVRDLGSAAQDVERLYYSLLNRAADPGALSEWSGLIGKRGLHGERQLATTILNSREYRTDTGGPLSNTQFVEALYEGALGRPADSPSLATDVHALRHGLTRADLAVGVADSAEGMAHLSVKPV